MTIEQSLRRRAIRHQLASYFLCSIASMIVLGGAWLLPHLFQDVANQAAALAPSKAEPNSLGAVTAGIIVIALGFSAIAALAWHLLRFAHGERSLALNNMVLADALCLSGDTIDGLERILKLLSPTKPVIGNEAEPDRTKELAALANLVKTLR